MAKKKNEETVEETPAEVTAEESAVEAAAEESAVEAAAEEAAPAEKKAAPKAKAVKAADAPEGADPGQDKRHKRAERIGIVYSDKMTDTVVVRVDRLVKHPMYRKYVKRRKKFMAHNTMGAAEGDKVRIVETRPLSARKRWRVIEIIQKAVK